MKSSTGQHYLGLDHLRALAMWLVFVWHFLHAANGYPVPFEANPSLFVLSLLDEGHVGVALFMTLSGYLFSRLLDGRRIHYVRFLYNRVLRLFPLLLLVVLIVGAQVYRREGELGPYLRAVRSGVLLPTLPNGGWSITVEFQFYLILPLLLMLLRRSGLNLLILLLGMIGLRCLLWQHFGQVQTAAYFTIIGRLDQFLLGILAGRFSGWPAGRHAAALAMGTGLAGFYWWFNQRGGFYQFSGSPGIWVILPTLEGAACAWLIAWYDQSFQHSTHWASRLVAMIGTCSYSLYLLHFFVVFHMADFIHRRVLPLADFHVGLLVSIPCFLLLLPAGYLSFRYVESPFLKLRKPYILDDATRS